MQKKIKKVLVVGGGTAGFLAAISLKTKIKDLDIKIVNPSSIPIIGVGEGTTAFVPNYLNEYLKLDMEELFREVKPCWKLGIKYLWGKKETSHFNYTFMSDLEEKYNICSKNNAYYLQSLGGKTLVDLLMDNNRAPCFHRRSDNAYTLGATPNGKQISYGYHLDNKLFVAYLTKKAKELKIEIINKEITYFEQDENGYVSKAFFEDKSSELADFFIDCSGFKSILLGDLLKEPFISFKSSLFCDTAITGTWDRQREDIIKPYTTAETMDSGWCWQVELRDKVNRGYVFPASMFSVDAAVEEMESKNPQMKKGEHKVVKFTTGRYRNFWVKNVAAVGNASGFVEPLEATGIHMICDTVQKLVKALIDSDQTPSESLRKTVSSTSADIWDDIRWFLAIHYKFNNKLDTEFWKKCRNETDASAVNDLIEFFIDNGPSLSVKQLIPSNSIFGYQGYMVMLLNQISKTNYLYKDISEIEKLTWQSLNKQNLSFANRAISMRDAFKLVDNQQWKWESKAA